MPRTARCYLVEVEDPAIRAGIESIAALSGRTAHSIAAQRVAVMLEAAGIRGERPNAHSWPDYLEMLRTIVAALGKPVPDVRVSAFPVIDRAGDG